ncbi:2-aminoadipate transaminase [Halioglobus japonicus]|nr:2-aminoadipate transaminase [Halioglobus japonicus]
MKRYEQLADVVAQMIRSDVLAPGDKVPSIRQASAQHGVSPSTVFQAYYLLESRGLIRARERSGYYVSENVRKLLPEPAPSLPISSSTEVSVNDTIFSVLDAMQHPELVPLGAAFPSSELFPLDKLSQSLRRANRVGNSAGADTNLSPGNELLRRAISRRYMTAGVPVSPEDIIITNGALEALTLSLQTVAQPGDVVAIESPGFYAALQAIQMLKLKAVEIPMDSGAGMNLAALEEALERQTISACWCMTNFQNPLGSTMTTSKKKALVELLAKYEVPLIEDDVYAELYFGNNYPQPAKAFDDKGLVILCSSFSKSLAPGYRIGWAVPGRYFEKIRRAKLMTTLSACVPAQLALADYLHKGLYDRYLRKLRQLLEDQQLLMSTAVATHFPPGTRISRPKGGFFLWVELPAEVDTMALYRLALEQGVSIAPGPIFSASGDYSHCLRLNYGLPRAALGPAVETVGRLACALMK